MSLAAFYEIETGLLRWECQNARHLIAICFAVPVIYMMGALLSPVDPPMPYDGGFQHVLWAMFGNGWGGATTLIATQLIVCWGALRYIRFLVGAALRVAAA